MRQKMWLKLIKDYDYIIHYHPGKANIVADTLSRKNNGQLAVLLMQQELLIREFIKMNLNFVTPPSHTTAVIVALTVQPTPMDKIKEAQKTDAFLPKIKSQALARDIKDFEVVQDGTLMYEGRLCVPKDDNLQ